MNSAERVFIIKQLKNRFLIVQMGKNPHKHNVKRTLSIRDKKKEEDKIQLKVIPLLFLCINFFLMHITFIKESKNK